MNVIKQQVSGQVSSHGESHALILLPDQSNSIVYLSYALVLQGIGTPILPTMLLDDWGNEIRGMKLYSWVRRQGDRFPRAEVFGRYADGRDAQYFLRDFEIISQYPLYSFDTADAVVGKLISSVVVVKAEQLTIRLDKPDPDVTGPLRAAAVTWWQANDLQAAIGIIEKHNSQV